MKAELIFVVVAAGCMAAEPTRAQSVERFDTRLAFDLGGVFEIYASRRSTVRIDVGDLATRLTGSSSRVGRAGDVAHDLQVGAGIGERF